MYLILMHEWTLENIIKYKESILKSEELPGYHLETEIHNLIKKGKKLKKLSTEEFINLILATKRPTIYAGKELTTGSWNRVELEILGDISVVLEVIVYDNGVWSPTAADFKVHPFPFIAELLFTPGTLLKKSSSFEGNTPDYDAVVRNNKINQYRFNELLEKRLYPVFRYIDEQARCNNYKAFVTIPGLGCGVFAGKFRGWVGEYLKRALIYILGKFTFKNILCIYFGSFDECRKESYNFGGLELRVRPNVALSQLCHPRDYLENCTDEFERCKLFKIVAWDHVSYPGNNFFGGCRTTDDGVTAAATNSMEVISGVKGRYQKGFYMPPEGKYNWKQVVEDYDVKLRVSKNVVVVSGNGDYLPLAEHLRKRWKVQHEWDTEDEPPDDDSCDEFGVKDNSMKRKNLSFKRESTSTNETYYNELDVKREKLEPEES